MAPAKTPNKVPQEECIQQATQEFIKAQKACEQVREECHEKPSFQRIARNYGIDNTTLRRCIQGRTQVQVDISTNRSSYHAALSLGRLHHDETSDVIG